MAKRHLPDATILRQLLRYEPDTGKLFWRERDRSWFNSDRVHLAWNARLAGKEAMTGLDNYGYPRGRIGGQTIRAHLVIWKLVHGSAPRGVIDHINHDKTDNRLVNLREITKRENHLNSGLCKRNTSGVTGVCRVKGRWQAMITVNYESIYLGRFDSIEDAAKARKAAERKYGFHANHGK